MVSPKSSTLDTKLYQVCLIQQSQKEYNQNQGLQVRFFGMMPQLFCLATHLIVFFVQK